MENKIVLITGAASGIGRALADIFARNKYELVLVDNDQVFLQRAGAEIKGKYNIAPLLIVQDLTLPPAAENIFQQLKSKKIRVDILVNDAGIGALGKFSDIDLDVQIRTIRLNVEALTVLTKLFLKQLENRSGRILEVSSLAAFQPGPLMAVYFATKSYVLSLSEALAEELESTGVTVTALCPGPVATPFWTKTGNQKPCLTRGRRLWELSVDDVAQTAYQGLMQGRRVVVPGKIGKAIVFLNRFLPHRLVTKIVKKLNQ